MEQTVFEIGVIFVVLATSTGVFSSSQPFVLGAVEPRQPVVLFMRACPYQSADFSIFYKPGGSWSSTLSSPQ